MVIEERTQLSRAVRKGVKAVRKKQVKKKLKKLAKGIREGQNGNGKAKAKNLGQSFVADVSGSFESFVKRKKRKGATFT